MLVKKITFRKLYKFIKNKIKNLHPLNQQLDYNFNWKLKNRFSRLLFKDQIFQVIDIGAAGLSIGEINNFSKSIDYICFDSNDEEIKKIKKSYKFKNFYNFRAYPYFIGKDNNIEIFNIYSSSGYSSKFKIDDYYKKTFLKDIKLEKSFEIKSISLDSFIISEKLNPDLIKIDTQGSELEILQNAEFSLNKCLMIETEVEIIPIYKNQPLFHDVTAFLYSKGFHLVYLNRVFMQKRFAKKPCRGQITFCDASYVLNIENVLNLSIDKQIKYILFLINYGLIDSAIELLDKNEEIENYNPYLKKFLLPFKKNSKFLFLYSGLINWIFIFFMSLFKTNGLLTDSDRSWNIR